MASLMYYVKREGGLFSKASWNVVFDRTVLGMYPDRETALGNAIGEADRTSYMGRQSEVWVYEGDGFVLHKAFQARKPPADEEDGKGDGRDQAEDIQFTVDDPTFDGTTYAADPSTDAASY